MYLRFESLGVSSSLCGDVIMKSEQGREEDDHINCPVLFYLMKDSAQ